MTHPHHDTICNLVRAGASVRIDARWFTQDNLQHIAVLAAGSKGQGVVTLANAGSIIPDNLQHLVVVGKSHVCFDFTG